MAPSGPRFGRRARALSDALRGRAVLRVRSLTNNRIGDDGARALAEALPSCAALSTLQYGRGGGIHPVVVVVLAHRG